MDKQLYIEGVTYSKYRLRLPDGKIVWTDDNFERLLGYSGEYINQKELTVWDIMLPEDMEQYIQMVQNDFKKKNETYLAHRLKRKDGTIIFVFCFGKQVDILEEGVLIEILIADITNTRTLQTQVKELTGLNADLNKEILEKNKILQSLLNNLADGVCLCEVDRGVASVQYLSDSVYNRFGVTKEQMEPYLGDITKLVCHEDRRKLEKTIQKAIFSNKAVIGEFRFTDLNHPEPFWVQLCLSVLSERKGKFTIYVVILDISQRKADEVERNIQNELLKLVIEGSDEKLLAYDIEKDVLFVNGLEDGVIIELFQRDNFLAGIKNNDSIFFEDREKLENFVKDITKTIGKRSVEVRMDMDKTGQYLWYRIMVVSVGDNSGNISKTVGRVFSIHEEKMQEHELMLRSERDSLTGVYNYGTFITKVDSMLKYFPDSLCALFAIDIDNFKLFNDAYGHSEGDNLLCETAAALEQLVSVHGGLAGRLGGDEFAVFFPDVKSREHAKVLAEMIAKEMEDVPCKAKYTVSIGISMMNVDENLDYHQLHYQADQALYDSKRRGKRQFTFFEDTMQETTHLSDDFQDGYLPEEGYLLDDIRHPIYISDLNTDELYYMNKASKAGVGVPEDENNFHGRKCYEVLFHLDHPCDYCTKEFLKKEKSLVWHLETLLFDHEHVIRDKIIDWHGKKCRMGMGIHVDTLEEINDALKERFDVEDALTKSLKSIASEQNDKHNYNELLETIAVFYGADYSSVIQYDGEKTGTVYQWKNSDAKALGDSLELFLQPEIKTYATHATGVLIINHVNEIENTMPLLCNFCQEHRIWSMYAIPILNNDGISIGRIMVFNPKLHNGDIKLLNLLALYIGNDLMKQKLWNAKQYEMTHDSLTHALNRNKYIEYASEARDLDTAGVVVIDVNDVRVINEEFGQIYADNLLKQFVDVMQDIFPGNYIYRMGHDDFIMVCENIEKDTFLEKVDMLKSNIQKGTFTACIGYVWDDFDVDIRRMEEHAYDLLYMEKQKWYEYKNAHSYKWNTLSGRLVREELKQGRFFVFLQPKVDYRTDRFYGAEALVRYAEKENLANVLARMEKSKSIKYLDLFVLEEVCKILANWQERGIALIPISCNFSRLSILEEGMTDRINEIVESYHVPKNMVEIEITESIGEMEHEMVIRMANKLHEHGFRIAMDDFGTKYSNISILASLKFDVIKLDRSMVYNIDKNETSKKILKHLIDMCKDIGVECVAEGVETKAQAEILEEIGCPLLQGFLYSKPVDAENFVNQYQENIKGHQE